MRVTLTSSGTYGDIVPPIALGRALLERGHRVRFAANPAFQNKIESAGLSYVPCGPLCGPEFARARPELLDHWPRETEDEQATTEANALAHAETLDVGRQVSELKNACDGSDLLIATKTTTAAPLVAELTGQRWLQLSLMPADHDADALAKTRDGTQDESWSRWYSDLRHRVGLPPDAGPAQQPTRPTVLASSPHFSTPISKPGETLVQTGFWFADPANWSPTPRSDALARFIDTHGHPLVLTLGSVTVRDPNAVVEVHAQAAAELGVPLVVLSGWAGLSAATLSAELNHDTIHVTGAVSHQWLLPQAVAVCHHGGIGVTAAALRAGCPAIVEPYGSDQVFNARRVQALGVGTAMHPHQLTPDGLVRALTERLFTQAAERRCGALATQLQAEDGLSMAVDIVEQVLRNEFNPRSWAP